MPSKFIKFESYAINNGLSQGMVNCILQDKFGFMWFATKDGLNRFDGYNFVIYKHDPSNINSIADNFIQTIFEDSKGRLWIGTASRGIDLFHRESETFLHFQHDDKNSNTICDNQIGNISEDGLGNIWIATINGLSTLQIADNKTSNANNFHFQTICNERCGVFQMLDKSTLVSPLDKDLVYIFSSKNRPVFFIDTIAKKDFCTDNFIKKIDPNFLKIENKEEQKKNFIFKIQTNSSHNNYLNVEYFSARNHVNFFPSFFDASNILWFHNYDKLFQIEPQKKQQFLVMPTNKNFDIILNNANYVYSDNSGIIWAGSKGYGIIKYNPRTEKFHHRDSKSINYLSAVADGRIIFSYGSESSLNTFDKGTQKKMPLVPASDFYLNTQLHDNENINAVIQDKNGAFWIGKTEILCYNTLKKSCEEYQTGQHYNFPIYNSSDNDIWFGSEKSFCHLIRKTKKIIEYPYPSAASNNPYNFLEAIYEDEKGFFWLGTTGGLFKFNAEKKSWTQFKNIPSDSTSISFDLVFSICPDPKFPQKYLWIGTNGGLNKFDLQTEKFTRFSEKDGLANNVVYGILSDAQNNLWMSTNKGLSKFNLEKKMFRNYEMKDGLQGNEFNRNAYCKTADGTLFFGGLNGFNYFNPNEINDNLFVPQIQITDFKINNQSVSFSSKNSKLRQPVYLTKEIVLDYLDNMISLNFASFDFAASQSNLYQYKLEGFDDKWIQGGTNNSATYTNLNPGNYIFKVKGSNSDLVWNKNQATIQLIILPPWYTTWWFRLALLLLLGLIIYSIYKYRLNEVKYLHNIRNRIASDLHDEIGSTLSSISLYGEVAQTIVKDDSPEAANLLMTINKSTHDMMEAMSDIVWTLNSKNDRFDNIVNKMRAYAVERMEPINCAVKMEIDEQIQYIELNMEQRKNLYLIFKEAINNAAKYAACKNIFVEMIRHHNQIILKIVDDGIGFSFDKIKLGNGLENINKRAKDLKGEIKIESKENAGTTIYFRFSL